MALRTTLARHRTPAAFLGGAAITLLLGSGVAFGAVPSTVTGSITACVNRGSGAVRIVDFQGGRRCSSRETTTSWSKGLRYRGAWSSRAPYTVLDIVTYDGSAYVARVAGTGRAPTSAAAWGLLAGRGAAGVRGPAGPAGPAGAAGLLGLTGPAGPAGAQGVAGPAGADGLPGAAGAQGVAGADGLPGAAGGQGLPGAAGAQGLQGLTGPTGPQGLQGLTGPTGAQGPAGPQGPAGLLGRVVQTAAADLTSNSHAVLDPQCPSGTVPISGGAHVGTTFTGWGNATIAYISESDLDDTGTGWASTAVTTSNLASPMHFVAHVVCVSG
jgi:hypothetical protein